MRRAETGAEVQMKIKMAGLVSVAGMALSALFAAVAAVMDWDLAMGLGLASFMGATSVFAVVVLATQRRSLWILSYLEEKLGAARFPESVTFDPSILEEAIEREVSDIARTVDGRIIGLYEMLTEERSPTQVLDREREES